MKGRQGLKFAEGGSHTLVVVGWWCTAGGATKRRPPKEVASAGKRTEGTQGSARCWLDAG